MPALIASALLLISTTGYSMGYEILPSDPDILPNNAGYTYCDGTIYVNHAYFERKAKVWDAERMTRQMARLLVHEAGHNKHCGGGELAAMQDEVIFMIVAGYPWAEQYEGRVTHTRYQLQEGY